jgi:integrase
LLLQTAINTGLRWGELIALRPCHVDLTTGRSTGLPQGDTSWRDPAAMSTDGCEG